MLGTKLKRLTAFVLCVATLLSCGTVVAFAGDSVGGSTTDQTLAEIKELLNAISYEEYETKNEEVPKAESTVEVDISNYVVDNGDGFAMVDGGLFTPQTGSVSWTVDVPETGKYAMKIEYYPDQNRSTSIERILKINDKVPFAEARFLTLPKHWVNEYADAVYAPKKGESAEAIAEEARAAGFEKVDIDDEGRVVIAFPESMTEALRAFCDKYAIRFFVNDIKPHGCG